MRRFNLSEWAVHQPALVLFLILGFGIAGALAFTRLGRAEDPNFTIKVAIVTAIWPGATAEEMQDQVSDRIEKKLQELPYFDRVQTYTKPSFTAMQVVFRDYTPAKEVPQLFYQLRKKLGDLRPELPRDLIGPNVNDEYGDVDSILYMLTGEGADYAQLKAVAEGLRQRLLKVPSAVKVNLYGVQDDPRLVGDLLDVDALRHRTHELVLGSADGLAEVEDVRALRHDDADAESRLPALTHEVVGGVLEAAGHGGDVAEPEGPARRLDGRLGDGARAVECAGDAERDALGAGLDRAGRNNGVLPLQGIEQRLRRNPKCRELGVAEFDEDLLVLHAVQVDLDGARHLEEPLPEPLRHRLELRVVGALAGEHVEDRVDIAILVVDIRADEVARQLRP